MKARSHLHASDSSLERVMTMLNRDAPPEGARDRMWLRAASEIDFESASGQAERLSKSRHWYVAGLVMLAIFVGGVTTLGHARRDDVRIATTVTQERVPAVAAPSSQATTATAEAPSSPPPPASLRVDDLPAALPPRGRKTTAPPTDAFLAELALVEEARAALGSGQARPCLSAVTLYEERFGKLGLFLEEIEVMRIEAMMMSGERAAARARAARFLETRGYTPYAERMARVLGRPAAPANAGGQR